METLKELLDFLNKTPKLQEEIIKSEKIPLIESFYNLSLHYGFSLEYFIKAGFRHELETQGVETIFRENKITNRIISDYFQKFGGNFDFLIRKIVEQSAKLKIFKKAQNTNWSVQFEESKTRKILNNCLDLLEEHLASSCSDSLVDFCTEVCWTINSKSPATKISGEEIVSSFIICRILAPRLIEGNCCEGSSLDRLKEIVKGLNKISLGDGCVPDQSPSPSILKQNRRFRNIIGRVLMKHRKASYLYTFQLPPKQFKKYTQLFLENLEEFLNSDPQAKGWNENLSKLLKSTKSEISADPKISADLKYLALWSTEDVARLARKNGLPVDFFQKWSIDGVNLFQLNKDALLIMGIHNQTQLGEILNWVNQLKSQSLTLEDLEKKELRTWSVQDLGVWLVLSGFPELVKHFNSEKIDGETLQNLKIEDYPNLGVIRPTLIVKLAKLLKDLATT